MNSSQLTRRIQTRTVYADYIAQKERQAQGCATDTAYSQGGLNSSVLLEIQQGFLYTASTTTASILSNAACPGCNNPPVPPVTAGPPSIVFTASNISYLGIDFPNELVVGTNDFTIEWFQYMTSNSDSTARVFSIHPFNETQIGMSIEGGSGPSRSIYLWWNIGPTSFVSYSTNKAILDAWHHLAVVGSNGNNLKLYLDGSNIVNLNSNYNIQNPGNWKFVIGAEETGGSYFDGYITNFRMLNGTALYNGSFSVPSIPLGNITNTALLVLANNSNAPFADSSSNNYTLNNLGGGSVSWSSNSPDFPF